MTLCSSKPLFGLRRGLRALALSQVLVACSATLPSATAFAAARQDANPSAAAAPAAEAAAVEAPAAETAVAPPVSPASSAIVHNNAVTGANGKPIDGVKLSTHDTNIQCPSICVAPNGTIHVVFLEQHARSADFDLYHRSSSDGGKTWSEAKNLSEVMPDLSVGRCQVAADAAGRVYVIWNVGPALYLTADLFLHAGPSNNLVYRVLSGGQWSGKAIPIHQMATKSNQQIGSASFFASTDPAGTVHVIWNEDPDRLHPEVMFSPTQSSSEVGGGALVMEATLNGTTPSAPREIYMTPVSKGQLGPKMDGLDMLNGYVDAAGQAHYVGLVAPVRGGEGNHFKVIENGGQKPGVDLPGTVFTYWQYPPKLLLDAQGRQHIITMYPSGERPSVRDYVVGSDNEPTTVRSVKGVAGTLTNFEAFQGPGGRMVVTTRMNDTGKNTDDELYVSMSSGGAWSTPINVTNNTGRLSVHSTNTSLHSNVATMSWGIPGASAATFDKSGHLLLIYVRNTFELFGSNALGVELAGGSTSIPNLMFLRF